MSQGKDSPVNVFVSYRHQELDETLAKAFAKALSDAGHEVFIDTGIRWGTDWVQRIHTALDAADFLLLLLSKEAAASEMVVGEVIRAKDIAAKNDGRPVILPIRIKLPFDETVDYHLSSRLQTIQQKTWDTDEDTPRLIRELLDLISQNTGWQEGGLETSTGGVRKETPQPYFDPRDLIEPGGAIAVDAGSYIERHQDEDVRRCVRKDRAMVTVQGARQTGKTSLIMRTFASIRQESGNLRTAFVDFQAMSSHRFESLKTIWQSIAELISHQLQLDEWDDSKWKPGVNHNRNLTRFMERQVFEGDDSPVLLCIDEIDRVFTTPVCRDFFSSIRSNYNQGAFDPTWRKVRWLLSTSSEPSFFIEDMTQSPFNIGTRVEMRTFTRDEVKALVSQLHQGLDDPVVEEVFHYVGGHPYLTHLLVYHLAHRPEARKELLDSESAGGGIFREHLHRFLIQLQKEERLARSFKDVLGGSSCADAGIAHRLESAGLVRRDDDNRVVSLCSLYSGFFGKELN